MFYVLGSGHTSRTNMIQLKMILEYLLYNYLISGLYPSHTMGVWIFKGSVGVLVMPLTHCKISTLRIWMVNTSFHFLYEILFNFIRTYCVKLKNVLGYWGCGLVYKVPAMSSS